MEFAIAGVFLVACLGMITSFILIFFKSKRQKAKIISIVSVLLLGISIWQIIGLNDQRVREAGFQNFEEQQAANKAGFETAAEWHGFLAEQEAEAARIKSEHEAQALAELRQEQAEEAERRIAEEQACRNDLQCWGDKHLLSAAIDCQEHIEKLENYSFEWTDGWLDSKFSRFRWKNEESGIMTYIGDQIMFQNGFGAMQYHIYFCDYDPLARSVLAVSAEPGRL